MCHLKPILVLCFSFFVFGFMINTLSYKTDVFEKSLVPCCTDAVCWYNNDLHNGTSCSEPAGVKLKTNKCQRYTVTCRDCIDAAAEGQECGDPLVSCKNTDGSCYGWCYNPTYNQYMWTIQKQRKKNEN